MAGALVAGGLVAVPSSALAATPDRAVSVDCATHASVSGIERVAPGQHLQVDQTNCTSVSVIAGSITPAPTGTPDARFTADAGTTFELAGSGHTVRVAVQESAITTPDPAGRLLSTTTVTIPQAASIMTTSGGVLGGITACSLQDGPHVYQTLDVHVSKDGPFTFRVVDTDPRNTNISALASTSPMVDPFLAVYRQFDPADPSAGVVGCNDDGNSNSATGTGYVLERRFPKFTATLAAGDYTLLLTTWETISATKWATGTGSAYGAFTPGPESATYELWGAAGSLELLDAPAFGTATPAALTVGTPYTATVPATGGGLTFAVTGGALPAGLALDAATGVISGTPTAEGAFSATVTATNSRGTDSGTLSFTVAPGAQATAVPAPDVLAPVLAVPVGASPRAALGAPFSERYAGAGLGSTFAVTGGALPPGLTLDASGSVTGTPTRAGTYTFTITATNPAGSASVTRTLVVAGLRTIRVTAPRLASAHTRYLAGRTARVRIGGLEAGERYRVSMSGHLVASGTAKKSTAFTRTITVPKSFGDAPHRIRVSGALHRGTGTASSGTTTVLTAKPVKRLKVTTAKHAVEANRTVAITVRRLYAGERVTVTVGGKVVSPKGARATAKGTYRVTASAGWLWGVRSIEVHGAAEDRAGATSVVVGPRR